MPNKPKQRFVELSVDEVSLVDSPANEEEFIVVKRLNDQEEGEMAEENTKKTVENEGVTEPVAKDSDAGAEKVSVEVEKATNEAVEKAMEQVTSLVSDIAKAVGANSDDSEGDDADVEKGSNMRGMYKAQLTKAGVKGDALKSAMEEFDKKFTDMKPPIKKSTDGDGDDGENVEKNEQAGDAEEAIQNMLDVLAIGVQKAKRFTPKREAALKQAIETLTELAKELSMQEIPVGSSPKTSTPAGAKYGASSVIALTKGLDELKDVLTEQLSGVQKIAKGLGERVEAIEKTRNPSNSVEGEGGTDNQEDVKKNFWAGVL